VKIENGAELTRLPECDRLVSGRREKSRSSMSF
jgi:hypothetical protein